MIAVSFFSVPYLGYIERRSAGFPKVIFVEATESNSGVGPVANQYIHKDPSPYHMMVQTSLKSTTKVGRKNRPAYLRVKNSY